jgi:hypothetical protein
MKALIDLDMNRIFNDTEVAVKERAARIIQEKREEAADPQLLARGTTERALACEQEAQRIVDTIPELIASHIANGEQQHLLLTVSHGYFWGYNYGAARIIDETQVKHNTAVAALVIQKCSGIDKLHVTREEYQQQGRPGGFFVRLSW